MKYVPSREDIAKIKFAAAREGSVSVGSVLLQPGYRYNTKDSSKPCEINIALVSDDPQWNDTDLSDYGSWAEFRQGIELTDDGRGIVDFYIAKRFDEYNDLLGNVSVEIVDGKLARIYGYGNKSDYFNVKAA